MKTLPQKMRTHFFSGLMVLAPLFLTLVVIGYLVRLTDGFIVNPLFRGLFLLLPFQLDQTFEIVLTKLALMLIVIAFVSCLGWAAEKFVFKKVLGAAEQFIDGIPFFNRIYKSFREIAQAFFGDKTGVFKRAVFLEYPRKGIWALGFVTQDRPWEIHERTGQEMVNVFVPSPPNPATGFFVFVPKADLVNSEMTIEEAIRMVISGGAVLPSGAGSRRAI